MIEAHADADFIVFIGRNAEQGLTVWVRPTEGSGGINPPRCGVCHRPLEGDQPLYPILRNSKDVSIRIVVKHGDAKETVVDL